MSALFLFAAAFLACAVEMVEALTIVLAVGVVRGWRSPLVGVGAAAVVLTAIVGALGPALRVLPLDALRLVVGTLLLTLGLQWLRKAILRASGYKPLRDEAAAFRRRRDQAAAAADDERAGLDWYALPSRSRGCFSRGSRPPSSSSASEAGRAACRSPLPRHSRRWSPSRLLVRLPVRRCRACPRTRSSSR